MGDTQTKAIVMSSAEALAAQGPDSLIWWNWVARHSDEILTKTIEHLYLTAIAVGTGTLIALALTVCGLRIRWTRSPIIWSTGVLYAIPSLALFGFLVPITGASVLTAEIALVSYCLLILVQNLLAGIDGVPASVKDAADGMGLTGREGSRGSNCLWLSPTS
ncbi:MAG: hypothetical protein R2735_14985 [Microthrixaceae bacterium]